MCDQSSNTHTPMITCRFPQMPGYEVKASILSRTAGRLHLSVPCCLLPFTMQEYIADNSSLRWLGPGIAFRASKTHSDKMQRAVCAWGSRICGVDDGDGWLRTSSVRYLPLSYRGSNILNMLELSNDGKLNLIADNSDLNWLGPGIAYRSSKSFTDKIEGAILGWGSCVKGDYDGDGWIRVSIPAFLPMDAEGVPILRKVSAGA